MQSNLKAALLVALLLSTFIGFSRHNTMHKDIGYRVGNELFDGGRAYNSFMLKDKVCFSYLANKNGEQECIIDAVKTD